MTFSDFADRHPRMALAVAIAGTAPGAAYALLRVGLSGLTHRRFINTLKVSLRRLSHSRAFWRMLIVAAILTLAIIMVKLYVDAVRCVNGG